MSKHKGLFSNFTSYFEHEDYDRVHEYGEFQLSYRFNKLYGGYPTRKECVLTRRFIAHNYLEYRAFFLASQLFILKGGIKWRQGLKSMRKGFSSSSLRKEFMNVPGLSSKRLKNNMIYADILGTMLNRVRSTTEGSDRYSFLSKEGNPIQDRYVGSHMNNVLECFKYVVTPESLGIKAKTFYKYRKQLIELGIMYPVHNRFPVYYLNVNHFNIFLDKHRLNFIQQQFEWNLSYRAIYVECKPFMSESMPSIYEKRPKSLYEMSSWSMKKVCEYYAKNNLFPRSLMLFTK